MIVKEWFLNLKNWIRRDAHESESSKHKEDCPSCCADGIPYSELDEHGICQTCGWDDLMLEDANKCQCCKKYKPYFKFQTDYSRICYDCLIGTNGIDSSPHMAEPNPLEQEMLRALQEDQERLNYPNGRFGDLTILSTNFGPGNHVVIPAQTNTANEHARMQEDQRRQAEAFRNLPHARIIDTGNSLHVQEQHQARDMAADTGGMSTQARQMLQNVQNIVNRTSEVLDKIRKDEKEIIPDPPKRRRLKI